MHDDLLAGIFRLMLYCWELQCSTNCRANGEYLGGSCIDIPIKTLATEDLPFKGNMDLERLRQ